MSSLAVIADVASLLGLVVSVYTLYKVSRLPSELKRQSRLKILDDLIRKLEALPRSKPNLTVALVQEVRSVIHMIRLYDVPRLRVIKSRLRDTLESLEQQVEQEKSRESVVIKLKLIRDEVAIR